MSKQPQYYIVEASALPEVFLKVAETKRLLSTGEAGTVNEATRMTDISRSAFYKYRDAVMPFQNMMMGRIVTIQLLLHDEAGLLSDILQLKTDEILAAIALNLIATGGTVLLLLAVSGDRGASTSISSVSAPVIRIPFVSQIPFLGKILSGQNLMTWLALLAVVVCHIFLYKTPMGLKIRAVGENKNAAESVGISSKKIQYIALILSGVLCSMGGYFLSGGYMNMFTKDMSAGKGFIALAASSMGADTPVGGFLVTMLFGIAQALGNLMQLTTIPTELIQMVPYLTTLIGLAVYSYVTMKRKNRLQSKSTL